MTTEHPTTLNYKDNCLEASIQNLTDGKNGTCATIKQHSNEVSIDIVPIVRVSPSCILSNGSVTLLFVMEMNQSCDPLNQTMYVSRHADNCKNSDRLIPCHVLAISGDVSCEVICPCSLKSTSCEIVLARRTAQKNEMYIGICEIH